jgi:hypothetical protein
LQPARLRRPEVECLESNQAFEIWMHSLER